MHSRRFRPDLEPLEARRYLSAASSLSLLSPAEIDAEEHRECLEGQEQERYDVEDHFEESGSTDDGSATPRDENRQDEYQRSTGREKDEIGADEHTESHDLDGNSGSGSQKLASGFDDIENGAASDEESHFGDENEKDYESADDDTPYEDEWNGHENSGPGSGTSGSPEIPGAEDGAPEHSGFDEEEYELQDANDDQTPGGDDDDGSDHAGGESKGESSSSGASSGQNADESSSDDDPSSLNDEISLPYSEGHAEGESEAASAAAGDVHGFVRPILLPPHGSHAGVVDEVAGMGNRGAGQPGNEGLVVDAVFAQEALASLEYRDGAVPELAHGGVALDLAVLERGLQAFLAAVHSGVSSLERLRSEYPWLWYTGISLGLGAFCLSVYVGVQAASRKQDTQDRRRPWIWGRHPLA